MSERPKKRLVEFIESYWTGCEHGPDYIWNDNHGELVCCKECRYWKDQNASSAWLPCMVMKTDKNWYCADGERR